jgi:hypothetical protein
MTVEDRLIAAALRTTEEVEPSPDLWSRVVHSIEEDRAHRRRVRLSAAVTMGVVAVLTAIGALSMTDGPLGRHVRPAGFEALTTVALVALLVVLGPAIRRFGRGYASDLWSAEQDLPTALIRLLDLAYYLVFAGYILLSIDLTFAVSDASHSACLVADTSCIALGEQLNTASLRIAGLLVIMGVLHAATIIVLPFLALISNSTRLGRPLPKWLSVFLIIGAAWLGVQALFALVAALLAAAGG